jgi:hypothetical protein
MKQQWSDRHRGAGLAASFCLVGGLTATRDRSNHQLLFSRWSGRYRGCCSTPDKLINGHKWILLAKSIAHVRGHAYKKH